jgi:hypothetical protein
MSSDASSVPPIDFLAIGHICRDLAADGWVMGGAAAYGGLTAHAIGCRVGVVTSGAAEDDWAAALPDVAVQQIASPMTTVFENVYTDAGRVQTVHSVAGRIGAEHVPPPWARAPMVLLGPIANEIDPDLIGRFSNSLVGVGPQGWLRRWDAGGRVYSVAWDAAAAVLPLAAVTFVSEEDLADAAMLDEYRRLASIVVLTQGARGCTVFCRGEARSFASPTVAAADLTGAGDVFAAAYLVRFHQTDGNLWAAAEFANRIAAEAITRRGLPAKMAVVRQRVAELIHSSAGW